MFTYNISLIFHLLKYEVIKYLISFVPFFCPLVKLNQIRCLKKYFKLVIQYIQNSPQPFFTSRKIKHNKSSPLSWFTCGEISFGEYGAVAVPVPGQYSHGVVLATPQLGQVTGRAGGGARVRMSAGLGQDCVMTCSGAGSPGHRHSTGDAVQCSRHICRITWCWRRRTSIMTVIS